MHFPYRVKQLLLAIGDMLCYAAGFYASLSLRYLALPTALQLHQHVPLFGIVFFLWIVINYINGLYDLERHSNTIPFYRRFAETTIFSLAVSIVFFYLLPDARIAPKTILLLTIAFGYTLAALWRLGYNAFIQPQALQTNIVLVGYRPETQEIIDILTRHPEKGYRVAALIDPDEEYKGASPPGITVYHGLPTIRPAITTYHADIVVIAPHLHQNAAALRELYELLFWPVHMTDLTSFYESITGRIPPSTFSEGWFLEHLRRREHPIYDHIRTLGDYLAILLMGVVLMALFPFIWSAIKLSSPGPALIRQRRIGYSGKIFTLYKFRSMYALSADGSAEVHGVQFAQKEDNRITPVGKFLRKTRLDELPQVWNLLKRDVTLIGPRPERPEIVKELQTRMPYYPLRHMVRPGLTGWALIHQNYTDNYDTSLQKLQYDLYYIKNRSWLLDVQILLRSINVIVRLMGQ